MKKWYNVFDKVENKGSLNCPICNHNYLEESFYSIEPRGCLLCKTELIIFTLPGIHRYIYTINLKQAPNVFSLISTYLSEKNNAEAMFELSKLIMLFSEKTYAVEKDDFINVFPSWPNYEQKIAKNDINK